jgi:8-hydroxy-5-deazaflavin:NADPH oxidoreductase
MKVTVVGAGNMGSAFVKQLHRAEHEVSVFARDLARVNALAVEFPGVKPVTADQSATNADAIILATGYADAIDALRSLGDLSGKVVVDITNPLTSDYMGLTLGHMTSASEEIAKQFPAAFIVKAFNTVFAQVLAAGSGVADGRRVDVFYASDSDHAKSVAKSLAESMGFAAVDAGALKNARYLEPLAGLNIYFGYGAGRGTAIAPTWIDVAAA